MSCYKKTIILFIFVAIYFLNYKYSFAAAWTQSKGNGQAIFTLNDYQSLHTYNLNGTNTKSDQPFRKYEFNPFIEYGLTNNLTIGANPTLQYWQIYNPSGTGTSSNKITGEIVDSEFFLRQKLGEIGNVVFSTQPLIKTPCALISNSDATVTCDSFEGELRGLMGYGFKWDKKLNGDKIRPFSGQYHFLDFEIAYRKRSNNLTDLVKIDSTAGFRFNDDILLLGQIFSEIGTRKETIDTIKISNTNSGTNNLYLNRYGNLKLQFSGVVQTSKTTSVQLGIYEGLYTQVDNNNFRDYQGILVSLWKGF